MKNLNSDELRTKLAKNNGKVTKLLLQNDEIVELLRSRELAPVAETVFRADRLKVVAPDGYTREWHPDGTYTETDAAGLVQVRFGVLP